MGQNTEPLNEKKWSKKYKRSIDCNNPKGFSQKAHCAGRKKRESVMSKKSVEEAISARAYSEIRGQARYLAMEIKTLNKGIKSQSDDKVIDSIDYILGKAKMMKEILTDKRYESIEEKVNPEMKKIYQLLIKYGNSAKDAGAMIKKNLKYVNKAYRNSTPRGKAIALVGLSALGEAVDFKKAHKKFKETGELPPHLKKLVKDLDKVKVKHKVKNIVVPGLEWMSKIKEGLDDLKNIPPDLRKSMKKKRGEGFASDAQRRAAFASGYKAKGKKKMKKEIAEQQLNLFLEKNVPTNPSKWAYYKSQAKKKFDVYPSAYAKAWEAKQYKAAGGSWRKTKG